jgi:hypothetical protein
VWHIMRSNFLSGKAPRYVPPPSAPRMTPAESLRSIADARSHREGQAIKG